MHWDAYVAPIIADYPARKRKLLQKNYFRVPTSTHVYHTHKSTYDILHVVVNIVILVLPGPTTVGLERKLIGSESL